MKVSPCLHIPCVASYNSFIRDSHLSSKKSSNKAPWKRKFGDVINGGMKNVDLAFIR